MEVFQFANQATWDRALRIVLGAVMLYLGFSGTVPGLSGSALAIFGWFPLVTGLIGWCPIYALLSYSSRRRRKA